MEVFASERLKLTADESGSIYQLTLHSEPCNEIGLELLADLEAVLNALDLEHGKVLVIHSTLTKGFCAGADLKQLYQKMVDTPTEEHNDQLAQFLDRIHDVANRIDMLPMITIGVIHGVCFGGGFELALTCDVLVAEKSARFCFPELRLGIIPGFGGIPRLKREFGNAVLRDILFTGRSINAKKANSLGFVSQVVAREKGLEVAQKMAEHIATFDAEARRVAKKFAKTLPIEELEQEKKLFLQLVQRDTVVAALKKFSESTDIRPYI